MNTNSSGIKWVTANWHVPQHVHAGISTRSGGVSSPPYNQLNLGTHVDDNKRSVLVNRERLAKHLKLPSEPVWLNQAHGNKIIQIDSKTDPKPINKTADGSYTTKPDKICVVMTADCLPLLLCDDEGTQVAAIHIGWRGFSRNIITNALEKFTCPQNRLIAWLGPCISAEHYEVDAPVYNAVKEVFTGAEECFVKTRREHWLMDLKQLVSKYLVILEVEHIYSSPYCTYSDHRCFFSHRRDGTTGRVASLIWMDSQPGID